MYFSLDIALPMLPGAFEFDPADSVETVQVARSRVVAEIVILPAPVGDSSKLSPPRPGPKPRRAPIVAAARPGQPASSHLARATVDTAPRSGDPH